MYVHVWFVKLSAVQLVADSYRCWTRGSWCVWLVPNLMIYQHATTIYFDRRCLAQRCALQIRINWDALGCCIQVRMRWYLLDTHWYSLDSSFWTKLPIFREGRFEGRNGWLILPFFLLFRQSFRVAAGHSSRLQILYTAPKYYWISTAPTWTGELDTSAYPTVPLLQYCLYSYTTLPPWVIALLLTLRSLPLASAEPPVSRGRYWYQNLPARGFARILKDLIPALSSTGVNYKVLTRTRPGLKSRRLFFLHHTIWH